jgi:hypothetical protein
VSDCERLEPTIEAYVAGDLDDTELGPLLAHCRTCQDCRQLLELHRDLTGLASRAPEPDEADFAALHARVLGEVDRQGRAPSNDRVQAPARAIPWYLASGSFAKAAAALAAAVLLFVTGLSTGRSLSEPDVVPVHRGATNGNGGVTNRLIQAINTDASSNRELADVEDSRFTYSNVSFRRLDGERVGLDFDVTTHVRLVEQAQSEIVREILVHSLLNPSTTGVRLKAMSYAAGAMEPKVRQALIFAMRHDENLAVRMKALTILSDQLVEPEVETAVLGTLRDDESVQMRLLALDHLAAERVDGERIRETIEKSRRPGDEALMVRLADYENQL